MALRYPDFSEAVKVAKEPANDRVEMVVAIVALIGFLEVESLVTSASRRGARMSKLVGFATFVAVATIALPVRASTWLKCAGHIDGPRAGTITHYAELKGDAATWDGQDYKVALTGAHYRLDWPASKPRQAGLAAMVYINREDGSYFALFADDPTARNDWSKPDDPGCALTSLKF